MCGVPAQGVALECWEPPPLHCGRAAAAASAMGTCYPPQLEYRSWDDAWYDVELEVRQEEEEGEGWQLKVHYKGFPEDEDELLPLHHFNKLEDFTSRLRYSSRQLQDQHCAEVQQGIRICASYSSDADDNRFFDAVVQQVCQSKHDLVENDELCTCTFKVLWLAGPCVHKTTSVSCGNICLLSPGSIENDPVVKDFVKLIEERLDGKVQSCGRNPLKRKAVNIKGSKIANAERRLGEPGKTESNVVDDNTFQSVTVSSKSIKMEKSVGDGSNAIENIVAGSQVLLQQVESSFNYLENPIVSGSHMESQINISCFSHNESGTNIPKTTGEASVAASTYCENNEAQFNLVRKEDKLSLDLNSMPVELETEQHDIPNPTGGLYSRTLTESLLQSSHSHLGFFSSNLNNANIEKNIDNSKDEHLEMDNDMGVTENPRPCNSGWLETEDSDIVENVNNGLNIVSKNIAGKSLSSSVDIRIEVRKLSEDHSLSAGHMKRPSSALIMNDWEGCYNCDSICEPLELKETHKNKEVTGNKVMDKTFLASCWGKGKRQKHTNNEMLFSEGPVGNKSNASDDVDALRSSSLTASHVKVSKKNDLSDSSKGSAVNMADIINSDTKHRKLKRKEISSPKLLTETVYIVLDEEDDLEASKKTWKNEILDLRRQDHDFVQLQESSSSTERRKESCRYVWESYKNVEIETEDNSIFRHNCEGKKKAPGIQRPCGGHSISDKCICSSSDYSDATDIPSSSMYCKHDVERCQHERQTSCTTCCQNGTFTGDGFTVCCESFSEFSYCQCCKLDKCNANALSDDESISYGEGTCCLKASNCRHFRKYIKSSVSKKNASTGIPRGSFEGRCGCINSECGHCGENVRSSERQFYYSEALVIENLEKDVSHSDVIKVVSSMIDNVVQAHILPSLNFEQFTRGFVWFQDHASLMKALDCLQDDNIFIVSSNGRPWVVDHIDTGAFEGIFGGFNIESKVNKHCCTETSSFNKILFVHKGTQEYEKAKSRKSAFLEFMEHLTILHKRLELEENKCVQNPGSD